MGRGGSPAGVGRVRTRHLRHRGAARGPGAERAAAIQPLGLRDHCCRPLARSGALRGHQCHPRDHRSHASQRRTRRRGRNPASERDGRPSLCPDARLWLSRHSRFMACRAPSIACSCDGRVLRRPDAGRLRVANRPDRSVPGSDHAGCDHSLCARGTDVGEAVPAARPARKGRPRMNTTVLISMLATSVAAASPLLLAALGELVVERSGVLNLGIEGIMLVGALTAVAATLGSGSVVVGILCAVVAGMLLGLLFAFLTVTIRADHVVAGLAMVLFGDGLSSFAGHQLVGIDIGQHVPPLALPWISDIPALGQIFFRQNALVYFSYLMVAVVWYFLYRTRPGLALRAAGEKPSAVDVVGWNVFRIRYLAVLFGAGMAGLAGAFLSGAYLYMLGGGMTAGRGRG